MRKIIILLLLILSFVLTSSVREKNYKLYSIFVYKFAQNIQWPEKPGDFVLGVYGNELAYQEFILLQTKSIGSRKIVIKKITSPSWNGYDLIFVPSEHSKVLPDLNTKTSGQPILIISETDKMTNSGINFVLDNDRLKFEVNKKNCESRNLQVSKDLILLAFNVQ